MKKEHVDVFFFLNEIDTKGIARKMYGRDAWMETFAIVDRRRNQRGVDIDPRNRPFLRTVLPWFDRSLSCLVSFLHVVLHDGFGHHSYKKERRCVKDPWVCHAFGQLLIRSPPGKVSLHVHDGYLPEDANKEGTKRMHDRNLNGRTNVPSCFACVESRGLLHLVSRMDLHEERERRCQRRKDLDLHVRFILDPILLSFLVSRRKKQVWNKTRTRVDDASQPFLSFLLNPMFILFDRVSQPDSTYR